MGLGGVISNLLSLGAQLIPVLTASPQAPSSSLSPSEESHQIETELKQLMRMLNRIKATLYDAEEREIMDQSVKLWLKELRGVAYDAEDVLDEYRYEVLRAQVEARAASPPDSRKRKQVQVPDDILDQIKRIRSRFAEIEKHRLALRLSDEDGPRRCNSDLQIAPTSHFVVESDIIGREEEKAELIRLLSSENYDGKIISGVTIVGTGGIGKTTLAQLVYNDQKFLQKFDKFGWVCVSDDFNVQRLTREVVESLTGKSCDLANLSTLQKKIEEEIRGKSVFLVLDDMWNENRNQWESFQAPFMSASFVKILVTTRNKHVAQVMQAMQTFNLSYMLEEKIWQLFLHYAFGEFVQNTRSNLIEIGKQIVKKCGMLPLAVKSIACLLRHEPKEESWREILGSELWESDAANEIFPPLQISYARLPTNLKSCFLYCSMFPRDYRYSADELVVLWISHGYVQTNGSKNAEKIGWEYIKQLWQRSFFEGKYGEEEFHFTLHDMVHDLARFNSRNGFYSIEGDMVQNFPEELYHLYIREWTRTVESPPGKFASLRTIILDNSWFKTFRIAFIFAEAKKLRAVRLASNCVEPDFPWFTLKHLRYLSLHNWLLDKLPECICSLYNLQNMTLHYCPNIVELPKSIGNLISLEELKITSCTRLRALPISFCQLKALRKLKLESCTRFKEVPPDMKILVSLEELKISECADLGALLVPFCQLKALRKLELKRWYRLKELPPDVENLISIEELTISGCYNFKALPLSLCQLKALRKLEIKGCSKLEGLQLIWGALQISSF
ncbi:hypothetical protein LUZ61_009282 [Rhynchospora tenuis]|uniref:Uncharacterized protein n=1 Tax=Rhynchospora tenuis TaxID=198213 RepID=A0AAD5ZX43_9POAL|nr:hypothetical protein LUZ61_009282 [Rhynchospora tenuis]